MSNPANVLAALAHADEMQKKIAPKTTGASPHPPKPKWLEEVQKRNPFYNEVFKELAK